MNPNSMIKYCADLFVASRNPVAACWSTAQLPSLARTQIAMPWAAGPDDAEPEDEDLDEDEEEDDDEFDDEDEDAGDEDEDEENDVEQTAEPDGQFPNAPDALKETERPGATRNRQGDRGGVS